MLPFATPMEELNRSFPGIYLCTIRRVRVSVVGLIPPLHGIRATLAASGTSRVVLGGQTFETVTVRRMPEVIAFTSPANATGVFELDPQPELKAPFEDRSVDATWEFRLPKPANPGIDPRLIHDVVVALDYTALYSSDYREQVLRSLPPNLTGERSFSLRDDSPDDWYELTSPATPNAPMRLRLRVTAEDFPINLVDVRVRELALYVAGEQSAADHLNVALVSPAQTNPTPPARAVGRVISTRGGSGAPWTQAVGASISPVGNWELILPGGPDIRRAFAEGMIDDLAFTITFTGRVPAWPQ